jgi:hypothetical protein
VFERAKTIDALDRKAIVFRQGYFTTYSFKKNTIKVDQPLEISTSEFYQCTHWKDETGDNI